MANPIHKFMMGGKTPMDLLHTAAKNGFSPNSQTVIDIVEWLKEDATHLKDDPIWGVVQARKDLLGRRYVVLPAMISWGKRGEKVVAAGLTYAEAEAMAKILGE